MEQLVGVVKHYAWGDRRTISELQGRPAPDQPEAELWLGAHPSAPSRIGRSDRLLTDAIGDDPSEILGPVVAERFGRLPFLLKVLAAAEPLSIQVHPDQYQAVAGFAREEAAGVGRDDAKRSYRDDNHKPEILCALTPFVAKCGFRDLEQTMRLVAMLAEAAGGRLNELVDRVETAAAADEPSVGVADLLGWLLRLPVERARLLVAAAVAGARELRPPPADESAGRGSGADDGRDGFGAELAWTIKLDEFHRDDIGVVVALLLNHVVLAPGQALFLGAGNLHAYLAGAGVELMASSDNVIRGGLTIKHVDVDELLRIVDTNPGLPPIQRSETGCHVFDAPIADFSLTRLGAAQSQCFEPLGPEIVMVSSGRASIVPAEGSSSSLGQGQAGLIRWADGAYRIETGPETIAWRASVGDLGPEEAHR